MQIQKHAHGKTVIMYIGVVNRKYLDLCSTYLSDSEAEKGLATFIWFIEYGTLRPYLPATDFCGILPS
jgi:hypothetical protein